MQAAQDDADLAAANAPAGAGPAAPPAPAPAPAAARPAPVPFGVARDANGNLAFAPAAAAASVASNPPRPARRNVLGGIANADGSDAASPTDTPVDTLRKTSLALGNAAALHSNTDDFFGDLSEIHPYAASQTMHSYSTAAHSAIANARQAMASTGRPLPQIGNPPSTPSISAGSDDSASLNNLMTSHALSLKAHIDNFIPQAQRVLDPAGRAMDAAREMVQIRQRAFPQLLVNGRQRGAVPPVQQQPAGAAVVPSSSIARRS